MNPPSRDVQLVIARAHAARREQLGIPDARRAREGDVVVALLALDRSEASLTGAHKSDPWSVVGDPSMIIPIH